MMDAKRKTRGKDRRFAAALVCACIMAAAALSIACSDDDDEDSSMCISFKRMRDPYTPSSTIDFHADGSWNMYFNNDLNDGTKFQPFLARGTSTGNPATEETANVTLKQVYVKIGDVYRWADCVSTDPNYPLTFDIIVNPVVVKRGKIATARDLNGDSWDAFIGTLQSLVQLDTAKNVVTGKN